MDAGIIRLIGKAHSQARAGGPLIGVAAVGTARFPGNDSAQPDAAPLQPHHTHFVLVPGSQWGDESPWLAQAASVIADGHPSLTVVINGGPVSLRDVVESIRRRRPVVAVRGTGRLADALALAQAGTAPAGFDATAINEVVASGRLHVVDVDGDPATLGDQLRILLAPGSIAAASAQAAGASPRAATDSAPQAA